MVGDRSNAITDIVENSVFQADRGILAVSKPSSEIILDDRGILAFTKTGRYNVYTLISDIDIQSRLGVSRDSDSRLIIETDLQKEAETFLSSIVLQVPEKTIGVTPQDWFDRDELDRDLTPLIEQQAVVAKTNFLHIFVTALPPRLPTGATLDTRATAPRVPRLGGARRMPSGPFLLRDPALGWGM